LINAAMIGILAGCCPCPPIV